MELGACLPSDGSREARTNETRGLRSGYHHARPLAVPNLSGVVTVVRSGKYSVPNQL